MKNVFVLGGTGLLGFETIKELLQRGYEVSTIARNREVMEDLLPVEVKERYIGDINKMSDDEVLNMLKGKDAFMYAAGLDERTLPDAPAVRFYYEQNVLPTQRLARLSREAGIKKFVIYSSYHLHSAELWPDLQLEDQPYVETRRLQEQVAFLEGEGAMEVMSLRLPYIFGTMPHRSPLWKSFYPRVQGKDVVKVPAGGSAMVTMKQVAEAAVGAILHGEHRRTYAISGINMKYQEFYEMIAESLGQTETIIETAPVEYFTSGARENDQNVASQHKEFAIHMAKQMEMQDRDAYIEPNTTMTLLKYHDDDVRSEIRKTLKVCAQEVQKAK